MTYQNGLVYRDGIEEADDVRGVIGDLIASNASGSAMTGEVDRVD
jgi:hypothetical protein